MRINIGSKSPPKVVALKELIKDYDFLKNAEVASVDVSSDVSENPMSLKETVEGAINRAKKSFKDCELSFGIEDGLMMVENTKTNYMNICVCAIFDGKEIHLGISSAFEYPKEVIQKVLSDKIDISEAYFRLGISEHRKLGAFEGAVGLLTKGRLLRKEYTKQSITMALIHLENSELY
jgi:inosine/xanthosine triphosphatase